MDATIGHWVEFYGGPHDGEMVMLPWRFIPGTENVNLMLTEPPEQVGENAYRPGRHLGRYQAAFWADEELGIVRMDWQGLP
jgi:hypothetical protein